MNNELKLHGWREGKEGGLCVICQSCNAAAVMEHSRVPW